MTEAAASMIGRNRSVSKIESYALEDGQDPLEAGAGVDVLARQVGRGRPSASRLNCMKTRFQISTKRSVAAVLGPAVVRRRPRPCRRRSPSRGRTGPVSPMAQKLSSSPMRWIALGPARPTLSIQICSASSSLVVHGDPEAVAVEAEDLGEELPGHRDGLGLEVVPEAEVAEHLEEGAVVGVGADDVDVGGAEALLNGGGPGPGRRLLAQEVRLEGHHAGDGEEHRRVVRDEAGRRDDRVAPVGEEAREGRPAVRWRPSLQLTGGKNGVGARPGPGTPAVGRPAQVDDIPTMGLFRRMLPVDPKNGASP